MINSWDKHLIVAILIAPTAWLLLFLWQDPALNLLWPKNHLTLFLTLTVAYPIVEEILFRGALQGWLREKTWGTSTILHLSYANITTSLLFSSLHFYNHAALWACLVFLPSLIFGYFRDQYSSHKHALLIPIFLHIYYNMGWIWLFR